MNEPRSRKSFRWMPAPVLSHNIEPGESELVRTPSGSEHATFGRGLYARKVGPAEGGYGSERPTEPRDSPRVARTMLRWQQPLRYLILWQVGGFTLTWHAPWCRRCDCPGAGWHFCREGGYVSGLGFELSYLKE